MGVFENIRESLRDIGQGAKGIITRKPTTPYSRKQERISKDYSSVPTKEVSPPTDYVPSRLSSGQIGVTTPTSSGGRSRGGGGRSAADRAIQERMRQQAASEARALQSKQAADAKKAADLVKELQLQGLKSKALKIQRDRQTALQAQAELNRILKTRNTLILGGAIEQRIKSKDVKTGDNLIVTQWRTKDGKRVQRIENLKTGFTEYKSFKDGQMVRGITKGDITKRKPTAADFAAKVKIIKSSDPNKIIVTFPNGQKGTINSIGTVTVGSRLAGKKYIFKDGVIIAVDGKSTFARDEYIPTPTVEKVEVPVGEASKIINKLNILRGKTSTTSIRNQQNNLINELSLLGLATATTIISGVTGYIALSKGTINLIRNPAEIKKLPGVLKNIPGAISEAGKSFGKLIRVSPTEAIGVIAGEYILFKGAGMTFKAVGKLSSKTVKLVKPTLRKADIISMKITGKTINIAKKSKIVSKAITKGKAVKKIQKVEIEKFKTAQEVSAQLKRAKTARLASRKKGIKTVGFGDDQYIKAIDYMNEWADNLAYSKTKDFIKKWKASGRKVGLGVEEEMIEKIRLYLRKQLKEMPSFKRLQDAAKLNEPFTFRLIKTKKIKTANVMFKQVKVMLNKTPLNKKMNSLVRKVKKVKKGVKAAQEVEIKKFKTAEEVINQLKKAKAYRKKIRKKGIRTMSFSGDDRYIKALDFMEESIKNRAYYKTKDFIKKWKASGRKVGLGQEEELIKKVHKYLRDEMKEMPIYKSLKEASRLNEPFTFKLIKAGKLKTAKVMFNQAKNSLLKIPLSKKMNSLVRKVKVTSKKVSPKIIKKKVVRAKQVRAGRKAYKKTNRYRMEKTRRIRKVTIEKLNRDQTINSARKYVDDLFDEIARRQKVYMNSLEYRQFKNVIKKRFEAAIKSGNKAEINKFKETFRNIIKETNKPSKAPTIKVVEKGSKKIQIIKDFQPEAPKGQYREIKVGNQVMLQEVKQVQKQIQKQVQKQVTKQVQRQVQKQTFVILSVQKQSINLVPLLRLAVTSLSALAFVNLQKQVQKSGKAVTTAQASKVLQSSAQDFKVLQATAQAISPKLDVMQAIKSAMASKQKSRQRPRLKTKQVQKKKKVSVPKIRDKKKTTRTLAKPVMTYGFVIKKSGKQVRLRIPPLQLSDAWDIGAKKLDFDLQRTGRLIPLGKSRVVAVIPSSTKNYYAKHSKKFRRFRQKKGKRYTLERTIIEKKKYVGDKKSEIRALSIEKARKKRKTPTKKKSKVTKKKKRKIKQ